MPILRRDIQGVPGLHYGAGLLSSVEQTGLLEQIDASSWITDLRRRVQHYGYRYDYKARKVRRDMYLGPLPSWAADVALRLVALGWIPAQPDQAIVNEYLPGQGISAHIDCRPCFGDCIVTVSLGSEVPMEFIHRAAGRVRTQRLQVGSALILQDEARHVWQHRIRGRKKDDGQERERRVSLTFRTVRLAK